MIAIWQSKVAISNDRLMIAIAGLFNKKNWPFQQTPH
jgi:hypothetical protein